MDRAEMVRRGAEAAWRVDWPGAEWEFASVSAEDREWYERVAEAVLAESRLLDPPAPRPAAPHRPHPAAPPWGGARQLPRKRGSLPSQALRAIPSCA